MAPIFLGLVSHIVTAYQVYRQSSGMEPRSSQRCLICHPL